LFSEYADVISVWELAKMLKIGRNTAYELIRSGSIPSVRIGRQIRVSKQAVIEYLSRVSREKEI
jgi:excisionase family DNA binding protein